MGAFRRCADQFTLVFYDHRCNGRSVGSRFVDDMGKPHRGRRGTARASGFLRSGRCSATCSATWPLSTRCPTPTACPTLCSSRRARENAPQLLAQRGYSPAKVELVRRWFYGEFSSREYLPIFWRISGAYSHGSGWLALARKVADGGWRSRRRPEALIFAGRQLLDG
jgi:proline iminopeptidase